MTKNKILFLLGILLFSCDAPTEEKKYEESDTEDMEPLEEIILENKQSTWMYYEGTIPCADCSGILTQLKLENSPEKKERSFELTETFLGTPDGDRKFFSTGWYDVIYGLENEPGAMAIQLLDENRNLLKTFKQDKDGNLTILSKEGKSIDSDDNYTLTVTEEKD
ncbi:MAG: copper resistance protein NlpE N-terminal domain-containing protein [Cyclobacteriaceae bacterium]